MNFTRLIPSGLLFVAATVFIIRANFIFYSILDEVNANRAGSQQIDSLFVNRRFGEVMSEHGKLFPGDPKKHQMKISFGVGFSLALIAFFALGSAPVGSCPISALIVQVTDSGSLIRTNWTSKSASSTLVL
jgi:hypothetical protein